MVLKCCLAKISVGAIKAVCWLVLATFKAAIAATTVLPEPTSPSKSRFIGFGFSRSFSICQADFF